MRKERHLSGDPEFWFFIALDTCVFFAIYLYLSYHRWIDPEDFFTGQSHLSLLTGTANTIILLISSYLVMQGVSCFRIQRVKQGRIYWLLAILLGVLFSVIKVSEYIVILTAPDTSLDSSFLVNYFAFTGFHLFHLTMGLIVLWFCLKAVDLSLRAYETAALYWHFIDIAWIFLLLQLYLAK